MAPLSTQDVADALRSRIPGLDTFRLHKLLYYCQGYHLATFGQRLFNDTVTAFDHGPVVGRFWYAERNGEPPIPSTREPTEAELNTIGYVVSHYSHLSGPELREMTHNETPWQRADADRQSPMGRARIEEEWMTSYFVDVAVKADRSALRRSPIADALAQEGQSGGHSMALPAGDDTEELKGRLRKLRNSTG